MEQKIIFDYPFSKTDLKGHNIKSVRDLNGFYLYDTDTIFINMTSKELKNVTSEHIIIKWFDTHVTHETLHHEIYMVTHKDANSTEERVVQIMTGEIK